MTIIQRRVGVPVPVIVLAAIILIVLAVLALAGDDDGLTGSVFNATDPNAVVTALNAGRAAPISASGTLNNVASQMADALAASGGSSAGDVNALLNGSGYQAASVGWSWTWSSWDISAQQLASQFGGQGASNLAFTEIGIASTTSNGATYYGAIWASPAGGGGSTGGDTGGGQPVASSSERLDGMLGQVNNFRASYSVCAMSINESLVTAAIRHSEDMVTMANLVHNGSDGSSHISRAQDAGYSTTWVAENIAGKNPRDDNGAFQDWVNSTLGHRENMLNNTFDEIGIAVAGPSASGVYYYTMLLGSQGSGCN